MSRNIHRLGDCNDGGGCITGIPQSTVFANDLLVAVDGSVGTAHPPCPDVPIHCAGAWVTNQNTTVPSNVFAEGIPVNFESNVDTCGHVRIAGSPNVFVNQ